MSYSLDCCCGIILIKNVDPFRDCRRLRPLQSRQTKKIGKGRRPPKVYERCQRIAKIVCILLITESLSKTSINSKALPTLSSAFPNL